MTNTFTIARIDRNLSPAQRTSMGLGPIETDPRDTAAFIQVLSNDPQEGTTVLGEFWYPYERGPMTPQALVPLLRAECQVIVDGDLSGRAEAQLVGRTFTI